MDDLFQKISNIISKHFNNLNKKINGIAFLEMLKYEFLEEFERESIKFNDVSENYFKESEIEDNHKKIIYSLTFYKTPNIQLNTIVNKDLLIISLKDFIKIDINKPKNKVQKTFKLYSNMGICLPKNSLINLNYFKDNLIVEIRADDKTIDIEN